MTKLTIYERLRMETVQIFFTNVIEVQNYFTGNIFCKINDKLLPTLGIYGRRFNELKNDFYISPLPKVMNLTLSSWT